MDDEVVEGHALLAGDGHHPLDGVALLQEFVDPRDLVGPLGAEVAGEDQRHLAAERVADDGLGPVAEVAGEAVEVGGAGGDGVRRVRPVAVAVAPQVDEHEAPVGEVGGHAPGEAAPVATRSEDAVQHERRAVRPGVGRGDDLVGEDEAHGRAAQAGGAGTGTATTGGAPIRCRRSRAARAASSR